MFFYSAESSQEHADASTHVPCRPQSVDVNRQGGDMRGGEVRCPTDGHENECIVERTGATRKTKQRLSKSRSYSSDVSSTKTKRKPPLTKTTVTTTEA